MHIAALITIGLIAGFSAGIFGIGGGLVIVPLMVFWLKYSQQTANGTSLVALLLPVGLLGAIAYYRAGKIDGAHIKSGLIIACGMFIGTYFGSRVALDMPDRMLKRAFGGLLLFVAARMFWATR